MSQDETKSPTIQAGEQIIDRCPICHVKFQEPVALNIQHECPNPQCKKQFSIMVFE